MGMAGNLFYNRIPAEGWLKEFLPFVKNGIKKNLPQFGKRNLKDELPEIIKVEKPKMRVVFFTGCMTDFVFQETGQKIISILKANNIETIIPKDLGCCGAPAYYMGDHKTTLKLAQENFRILSQLNPDYIIINCATCGQVLKSVYEILLNVNGDFSDFANKVIDIHKFLLVNKCETEDLQNMVGSDNKGHSATIKQLQKAICSDKKIRVTYHDPCHLKRGLNTYLEPRKILKSLPWVDFVEMENPDACCGGAGGFNLKHYDLSLEIGKRKADSIKHTGADVVATGCPACQMQIMDVLNRAGYNRPVLHTVELLNY
jgi:glycolate oxidase iron-sulfur subunit